MIVYSEAFIESTTDNWIRVARTVVNRDIGIMTSLDEGNLT